MFKVPAAKNNLYFLVAFGFFAALHACIAYGQTYSTKFPGKENPISESGHWINGGTTGLDWNNIQTSPGFANGQGASYVDFADPTAILAGVWATNQTATETIYCNGCSTLAYEEAEVRLNTTIIAHHITGYEISCSLVRAGAGSGIVRWDGASPANFKVLATQSRIGCKGGDVHSATNVNGVISEFINGVLVLSATDSTYTGGAPGFGVNSCKGGNTPSECQTSYSQYGISSFSATGSRNGMPPPPTPPLAH
jgi:hypothetical protein